MTDLNKIYLFITAFTAIFLAAAVLLFISTSSKTYKANYDVGVQKEAGQIVPSGKTAASQRVSEIALSVLSPREGDVSTVSVISVRGKTLPEAEVFINDKQVRADDKGNFSASIALEEGENYVLVAASDASGNYSEKELTVSFEPVQ